MWRMTPFCAHPVGRRTVLKTGWALAALEIASAFPIRALGEQPVKIGMMSHSPVSMRSSPRPKWLAPGLRSRRSITAAAFSRQAQLLIEDLGNDIAVGVEKTRQLIDRD